MHASILPKNHGKCLKFYLFLGHFVIIFRANNEFNSSLILNGLTVLLPPTGFILDPKLHFRSTTAGHRKYRETVKKNELARVICTEGGVYMHYIRLSKIEILDEVLVIDDNQTLLLFMFNYLKNHYH